ncbi:holotricin-3-like [Penaeus chinensis]|uniref:holotricin-3-like n=1 Tax=Penaeus chinensis TaxID=139456 RepID=UPI001FB61441|nr:holotricin-3-like [Penaeus chinensis]
MCKRRIKRLQIRRRKSVSLEGIKEKEFYIMMANRRLLLLFLVVAVALAPLAVADPLPVADPHRRYPGFGYGYGHGFGNGFGHGYGHHGYGHGFGHGFGHHGYGGPGHFLSHLLHGFGHHHFFG